LVVDATSRPERSKATRWRSPATSSDTACHPVGSRIVCEPGALSMISATSSPEIVFFSSRTAAS